MAPKPNRPQIFDVSHPNRSRPSATSRPVIVGHRPMPADPMVRQRPDAPQAPKPPAMPKPEMPKPLGQETLLAKPATVTEPTFNVNHPDLEPVSRLPEPPEHQPPSGKKTVVEHHDPEHFKMRWWTWTILILIGGLIGAYLAIDSGLLKSSINLPFHLFKQDTADVQPVTTTPIATVPVPTPAPTIPDNWTTYQNQDIGYQFSYPKAWGAPVATNKAFEVYKFSRQENILLDVGTKDFCPQGDAPQTKSSQGWYAKNGKFYLTWCKNSAEWNGKDYPVAASGDKVTKIDTTTLLRFNPKVADQSSATHAEVEAIFNLSKNITYSGVSLYRSWTAADKLDNTKVVDEFKQVAATFEEL